MKLNIAETVAAVATVVVMGLCVIFMFLGSNRIMGGKGESAEPLPEYVRQEYKVNINAATAEEIAAVEGISRKVAEDIVVYRNIMPITEYDQLLEIEGIDEAAIELIRDKITFVN